MMLKKIVAKSKGIVSEDRAAALVEYGMVVGLIAVASIGAVYQVGERTEQTFCLAANALASDMNGHETDPDCETIIANSGLAAGGNAAAQLSPREQEMIDSFSLTTFAHDANARTFDATWAMASGDEICKVQVGRGEEWVDIANFSCGNSPGSSFAMPSFNSDWSNATIRLFNKDSDLEIASIGTVSCAVRAYSATSTPNVDEDCNGGFDNRVSETLVIVYPKKSSKFVGTSAVDGYCRYEADGVSAASYETYVRSKPEFSYTSYYTSIYSSGGNSSTTSGAVAVVSELTCNMGNVYG